MILLKTYSDAAGRTCRIMRDGTLYRVQYAWGGSWESVACHTHDRAEHLAAHHMAAGVRLWCPSDPMTPENAQEPREATLTPCGGTTTPKTPKNDFATPLQRP